MARVGGAQVFFDVLATFNARRLLADQKTVATMMKAAYLDTLNTLTGEFQAAGQLIDAFTDKVMGVAVAFEEARIDFEKFVNVTEQMEGILPGMVDNIVAMGEGFAFTGEEALKAASRMAQMGAVIGRSTIETGTEMGVMFGLISGMETGTAMKRLTNLMQQTGFHMSTNLEKTEKLSAAQFNMLSGIEKENMFRKNTVEVLNQLNTVENRSIATMEQLTYTMNQFASQAALTGSSIAEMAAMSAALIEAGEQQGAAGRALRMMYARLGGNIAGARDEMEAMGIAVTDSEGGMRTLTEVMVDLKKDGWDELTAIQQQNIAQSVSGNRHYVRFIKLMENLHRVTDLTSDSLFDFDSAQEEVNRRLAENAVILEAVEAKLTNVDARIGKHLLPGMIAGKEATLMFNEELEKFAAGDYGDTFGDMANSVVKMRGIIGLVGPFIQMQVVARGLVVGFETMRSVLAGIKGDSIAITRQHFNSTALMDIANQTTAGMRKQHAKILEIMGKINQSKMFDVDYEQQSTALLEKNSAILGRQLATEISKDAILKKEHIKRQLMVVMDNELLAIGGKLEGSMTKRLTIMQNQWEMGEKIKRQEHNRAFGAASGKITGANPLPIKVAREHTALAIKDLAILTKRRSLVADEATFHQRDIHSLQTKLSLEGQMWINKEGHIKTHLDLESKTLTAEAKRYKNSLGLLTTKQAELKTIKEIEFRVKGELIHLDNVTKKSMLYVEILKNIKNEHVKIEQLLKMEAFDTEAQAVMHKIMLESGIKEHEILQMNIEGNKQVLAVLNAQNVEQKEQLEIKLAINKKIEEAKQSTVGLSGAMMATGRGLSGGLTSASMLLPVMGGLSGNARMMRLSMAAMSLSMVPMVFQMTKGAFQAGLIALNMGAVELRLEGSLLRAHRIRMVFASIGILITGGILYAFDKMAETAERASIAMTKLKDDTATFYSTLETLQGQKFLTEDEVFSEQYNIVGIDIKRLSADYEYLQTVTTQFSDAVLENGTIMEKANQVQVDGIFDVINALQTLYDMQDGRALTTNDPGIQDEKDRILDEIGMWTEEVFSLGDKVWDPFFNSADVEMQQHLMKKVGVGTPTTAFGIDFTDIYGNVDHADFVEGLFSSMEEGIRFTEDEFDFIEDMLNIDKVAEGLGTVQDLFDDNVEAAQAMAAEIGFVEKEADVAGDGLNILGEDIKNLTEDIYGFGSAREEVFFGGKYGNVTGSLYKQVVQQGVGTLYHKNEVIMSNNFHGFFNEEESATKIIDILDRYFAENR
tara:strand:+ start:4799 stop:8599 length:3801 start_codon:yes stop_codon:yes gene_type:complete